MFRPPAPATYGSGQTYPAPTTYGQATAYGSSQTYGSGQTYGSAQAYGSTPAYGPTSPGPASYEPPYGQPAYDAATAYDAVTEVFERPETGYGNGHQTAPAFDAPYRDDDFARAATARIDLGPHAAFGPPPGEGGEPDGDAGHVFTRIRRIRSHARERRRRGWIGVVVVLLLFAGAAAARFVPGAPFYPQAEQASPAAAEIPFHYTPFAPADVATEGFLSWAYVDLRDGSVVGSSNMMETSQSGSMIAVWLGADLLRRAAEEGTEPTEADLADIEAMIRDDDLAAADRVLAKVGGNAESIGRLPTMCNLSDTGPGETWRATEVSARDAARIGGCIFDGRAAGAEWTPWLLNVMRQVRGDGDFGIREAFPEDERPTIAIKNGVLLDDEDGQWRANCLAIGENWALAILQRYPATGDPTADLAHVDAVCQRVVGKLTGAS